MHNCKRGGKNGFGKYLLRVLSGVKRYKQFLLACDHGLTIDYYYYLRCNVQAVSFIIEKVSRSKLGPAQLKKERFNAVGGRTGDLGSLLTRKVDTSQKSFRKSDEEYLMIWRPRPSAPVFTVLAKQH